MLRVDHMDVTGLPAVSFEVRAGECVALMGPSGSGKTLLLRAVADLDPAKGFVFLEGAERREMSASAWRRQVRFAAAEPGWWADTPRPHYPVSDRLPRMLDALGLDEALLDRPIAELSTGERQRLALARTVADGPKVLLLDEPTAALDPPAAALAEELIRFQLLRGCAVVLATHDIGQACRLAGRSLSIVAGRLVEGLLAQERTERPRAVP